VFGTDGARCGGSHETITTIGNKMLAKLIIFERTNLASNAALERARPTQLKKEARSWQVRSKRLLGGGVASSFFSMFQLN